MKAALISAVILLTATALLLLAPQLFHTQLPERPNVQQSGPAPLTANKDVYAVLSSPVSDGATPAPLDRTHVADNALCYDRFAPDCEASAVLRGNADRTYLRTGNVLGGRVDVD